MTSVVIESWKTEGRCLRVGEVSLTRLAARVGRTPFYAYDRKRMADRVAELRRHLPRDIRLHYAIKANPMPAVVQHMASLVDGLDVASAQEMMVALDTGTSAANISFAGPGKGAGELSRAIAASVLINVESEYELMQAAEIGKQLSMVPRVAVRVNPDFDLKSSGMRMGGGSKQFGIDAERVPELLGRVASLNVQFEGFHIFAGSQNLKAEAIIEAQEKTLQLAHTLAQSSPVAVKKVNLGGGFGIPYFHGDQPLDLSSVGRALGALIDTASRKLRGTEFVIELGRYLVGEAGIYVCRVVDRKVSRGQVFLVTDGGLHHHLAASGNFGQVIRKNYPIAIGNKMVAPSRERVSVVGPLCTPLDLLGDKVELPVAEIGDLVVVFQSGAYGPTASPTAFLGHPPAAEVLV